MSDDFDLARFALAPSATRWLGHPLVCRDVTGSTNDDAREAALSGAVHGYTVIADTQHGGRGRRGRAWHSEPGTGLYFTVVLRPKLTPADAPLLTLAAGLAVAEAIAPYAGSHDVTVKWPNDVRIGGRKVAGILVEGSIRGPTLAFALLGVGINVNTAALPDELAAIATSVRIARGEPIDRTALFGTVLARLEARIDALLTGGPDELVRAVSARCDTLGARIRSESIEGTATAITPRGGLLVHGDDGAVHEILSGEVVGASSATKGAE